MKKVELLLTLSVFVAMLGCTPHRTIGKIKSVPEVANLYLDGFDATTTPATFDFENEDEHSNNGLTALHFAALYDHLDVVKELLARGADLNLTDIETIYHNKTMVFIHLINAHFVRTMEVL